MKGKVTVFSPFVLMALITGIAWGATAVPVSPGNADGVAVIEQDCPTFSWSSAGDFATYRIEVYEQISSDAVTEEQMKLLANPVMKKEIAAAALSWTPSEGECLTGGRQYVWYVKGANAGREGNWSGGFGFQVRASALTVEQKEAVQEVVKGLLGSKDTNTSTAARTAASTAAFSSSNAITPQAFPSTISAYGNSDTTILRFEQGNYAMTGQYNSFFGSNTGIADLTGAHNTFIGFYAGFNNTNGNGNTFIGSDTGISNTSGGGNTFVGYAAGNNNNITNTVEAEKNTFLGASAGIANTSGHLNTFVGYAAGHNNLTGYANVFLGNGAGYSETGSNKLYIDNCFAGGATTCNQPLIKGDFEQRTVQIDGSLTTVTVATPSDERYKKDILPLKSSLDKVLHLQGVSYEWDKSKVNGAGYRSGKQIGLIAQEVEKVLPELVQTGREGYKSLSYDKLVPVLIEAVKEQQATIVSQGREIAALKEKLERALAAIDQRLASAKKPAKAVAFK